jgi:hypothetical protein
VRQETIVYTKLATCELPAAYLLALYGRYEYVAPLRLSTILIWDSMIASGGRRGLFTTMDTIESLYRWNGWH